MSLLERHVRGMAGERQGNSMACVNQIRPHCVNQTGKTQSKPLAKRHENGMGTAWERHGMCESGLKERMVLVAGQRQTPKTQGIQKSPFPSSD
jgi:hypothetical protein